MKTTICFYFCILFILTACDSPQTNNRNRSGGLTNNDKAITDSQLQTINQYNSNSLTDNSNMASCPNLKTATATEIGEVSVCPSLSNELQLTYRPSIGDTTTATCLIPTYIQADGRSTYLGEPVCVYHNAGALRQYTFVKTRYLSSPVNGVMIMKQDIVASYFQCLSTQDYALCSNFKLVNKDKKYVELRIR